MVHESTLSSEIGSDGLLVNDPLQRPLLSHRQRSVPPSSSEFIVARPARATLPPARLAVSSPATPVRSRNASPMKPATAAIVQCINPSLPPIPSYSFLLEQNCLSCCHNPALRLPTAIAASTPRHRAATATAPFHAPTAIADDATVRPPPPRKTTATRRGRRPPRPPRRQGRDGEESPLGGEESDASSATE